MKTGTKRLRRNVVRRFKAASDAAVGALAVGFFRALRLTHPDHMSNLAGRIMRRFGPMLPEHRIGRANLAAAYPEKSHAEIEEILRQVWDNIGRVGAEFAHIDRLWDYDPVRKHNGRILNSDESEAIILRLRDDGRPALIFSAHLANWELGPVGAHSYGMDTTVVYRRPNLSAVADAVIRLRGGCMGTLLPTGLDAPVRIADAMTRGSHIAMMVDQYDTRGVDVTFFGRRTKVNPMLARLARHFDCPIHGGRVVRHGGNQFRLDMTEAIPPRRDPKGDIDVQATMQAITDVVEGWVREHPEQWLWVHRRWRDK